MKSIFQVLIVLASSAMICSSGVGLAQPLPGEVLKFDQEPMIATSMLDVYGTVQTYYGHDELSTAWAGTSTASIQYQGTYMADDFADKVSTPVVALTWWGSYMNTTSPPPLPLATQFLISFESDVPAGPNGPSHPGSPILSEVVTLGALTPASGTFTETAVAGSSPTEPVYQYNAELTTPFPEQANTVYWLKIVALDNQQAGSPTAFQWGWHSRDYTIQDLLASTPPLVNPGENLAGSITGLSTPVWEFQDDAVQGQVDITASVLSSGVLGVQSVTQTGWTPQNYVDNVDGPLGISAFSKDLAFQLYTTPVPEPGTMGLLFTAGMGLLVWVRKRRG